MRLNYAPWPHLDIGGLPKPIQQFLLFTIVVSMYTGLIVLMVIAGLAVTNVMSVLLENGISDFSNIASEIAIYLRDAKIPA